MCQSKEVVNPEDKLVHEGWGSIKDRKRHCCTDCLFLLLLIAAWLAMTLLGFVSCGIIKDDRFQQGDPKKLINPIDYNGYVCGDHDQVWNKPYGYYLMDGSVVCVEECPSTADYQAFYCRYDIQTAADSSTTQGYEYVSEYQCMYQIETRKFLNRCFPNMNTTEAANLASQTAEASGVTIPASDLFYLTSSNAHVSWFNNFFGDIYILRNYVFGFGLGVATLVGFVYLEFLRIPCMLFLTIWTIIITIFVVLIVGSFLLWKLSYSWRNDGVHTHDEYVTMQVISYIGMGTTVLYFCVMIVLRKRINLAIGIVKEAAKALVYMPSLVLIPCFQAIGIAMFLVPWIIFLLFIASSGDMITHTVSNDDVTVYSYTYRTFAYNKNVKYSFLYMIFCWFWTSEFIIGLGQLIIAMSFADWYFTRDKSKTGSRTVCWAFCTSIMHHMGTVAFGSLILAVIRTIRTVVYYLQRKAKKSGNKVLEYALCCVQCCLTCLDKCIKFINKHAYIMTAVYGDGFCSGSARAFHLLLRNVLRVGCVSLIGDFVLLIGKLFVPIVTTFVCYLAIGYNFNKSAVSGIIGPLVIVFIISYFVSCVFSEIFGMGIETILYCFIADEEMFPVGSRYAEAELIGTLAATNAAHAEMKANQKARQDGTSGDPSNVNNISYDNRQKYPDGHNNNNSGGAVATTGGAQSYV